MRSLVHQHVSRAYMTPQTINVTNMGALSGTSFLITPDQVPVEGNVMYIMVGGTQSRTVTPPAGWTLETKISAGSTMGIMRKVATASEPANYTVNFSGSLDGGACFIEMKDVDVTIAVSAIGDESVGAVTSFNVGNYSINTPGVVFTLLSKSGTNTWTPDNGFTVIGAAGQFWVGRKIYAAVDSSETVTWSGASETVSMDVYVYQAKYVQ